MWGHPLNRSVRWLCGRASCIKLDEPLEDLAKALLECRELLFLHRCLNCRSSQSSHQTALGDTRESGLSKELPLLSCALPGRGATCRRAPLLMSHDPCSDSYNNPDNNTYHKARVGCSFYDPASKKFIQHPLYDWHHAITGCCIATTASKCAHVMEFPDMQATQIDASLLLTIEVVLLTVRLFGLRTGGTEAKKTKPNFRTTGGTVSKKDQT